MNHLDEEYGSWIADQLSEYLHETEFIGLHGHTVFHYPLNRISCQLGSARTVAKITGKPTIANFRIGDILIGGQGAPLVPIGEKYLFPEYDCFLNLGGICNATIRQSDNEFIAGDIGPCNQVANYYAHAEGKSFDDKGAIGSMGSFQQELFDEWSAHQFFKERFPKSLANAWVRDHFLIKDSNPPDTLNTFYEFISDQISSSLNGFNARQILVTGGGAYNSYLIKKIRDKTTGDLVLPDQEIMDFKEALVFGFLAILRAHNIDNVMASCTGARKNSCTGVVYFSP